MKYLQIQNLGEVDLRAITLMGASSKSDGTSIGFFGSGFCYAIACVLRKGLDIRIFSGTREIVLATKKETFRGESFDVIYVNGQATSFTTRTGPKWEIRDAIREFWSNALDEGGAERTITNSFALQTGHTTILLEINDEVQYMLDNWNMFFLDETQQVLSTHKAGRVLKQPTTNYFRRGIWICEDREEVPLFSYDLEKVDLPESRKISTATAKYNTYDLIASCFHDEFLSTLLANTCGKLGRWEWFVMNTYATDKQKQIIKNLFKHDYIGHSTNRNSVEVPANKTILWCDSNAYDCLSKFLPTIEGASNYSDKYQKRPWPIGVETRVRNAITHLASHGIDLREAELKFVAFTNEATIAMADMKTSTVLIGDACLQANDEQLNKALIEEWTHIVLKVQDYTVEQQHVYLNLICSLIEKIDNC